MAKIDVCVRECGLVLAGGDVHKKDSIIRATGAPGWRVTVALKHMRERGLAHQVSHGMWQLIVA